MHSSRTILLNVSFSLIAHKNDNNIRRAQMRYNCYFVYSVVVKYESQVLGNDVSRHVSKTMRMYPYVGQFESVKRGEFTVRPWNRDRGEF